MFMKLVSAAVFSTVVGLTLAAPEAQARRLFWWQALPPDRGGGYDIYGDDQDYQDGADAYSQDLFNQEQYDLYMREMNKRRHKRIYDQSYYDAQPEFTPDPLPVNPTPKPKVSKIKKKPKVVATAKTTTVPPEPTVPSSQTIVKSAANLKVAAPQVGTKAPVKVAVAKPNEGVETITDETKSKAAQVTCAKGASIVTSYGFGGVTSKSCSGGTYVYGATRAGKSFEIQVSAANGELTAVKKL